MFGNKTVVFEVSKSTSIERHRESCNEFIGRSEDLFTSLKKRNGEYCRWIAYAVIISDGRNLTRNINYAGIQFPDWRS